MLKGPVTHRGRKGDARPAHWKFAILASAMSFARCASSFVTRSLSALNQRWTNAGPTLCIRCVRRDLLSMLKSVRGARRMNVYAKRTPDMRGAVGQRQTYAEHTPCIGAAR